MIFFNAAVDCSGIPCTHHKVSRVELAVDGAALNIWLDCWVTEQSRLDGNDPAGRAFVQGSSGDLMTIVAGIVTGSETFQGAVQTVDRSADLDTLRGRKWSEMKVARREAEDGGFDWGGDRYDSDPDSQRRIIGAASASLVADVRWLKAALAALAEASAATLPRAPALNIDWTLANNEVRTLDGTQIVDVGLALLTLEEQIHAISRAKRALIFSPDATEASIEAVTWP